MMSEEEGDTHILALSASMERPWCGTGAQSSTSAKQQRCRTLLEQNILQVLQEHRERERERETDEEGSQRNGTQCETGALRFTDAPSPNSTQVREIRGGLTFPSAESVPHGERDREKNQGEKCTSQSFQSTIKLRENPGDKSKKTSPQCRMCGSV